MCQTHFAMKVFRNILILGILAMFCIPAQAQVLNRINRAAQNAAERAAERAVTKKVEQEVTNAVEKAFEAGERKEQEQKETPTVSKQEPAPYTGPMRGGAVEAAKFPFEKGSYVQVAEALGIEVSTTVYFTRFGEWTAVEDKSEIRMFGFSTKVDKLTITKGTTRWEIDLTEKTGTKYEIDLSSEQDAVLRAAIDGSSTEGVEITELGQENYLGYACRKVHIKYPVFDMDVTCLSYGTLVMKTDGRIGPLKTSTRITSIDMNAPSASKFEVPADVTIASH